jgi:hypothetical protein
LSLEDDGSSSGSSSDSSSVRQPSIILRLDREEGIPGRVGRPITCPPLNNEHRHNFLWRTGQSGDDGFSALPREGWLQ